MVADCISEKILVDGSLQSATAITIPQGATVIYDVLRVVNSVPLFIEDHSARFFKSFDLSNRERPFHESEFSNSINTFIKQTKLTHGNIRCVYYIANTSQFLVYEIKHFYPGGTVEKGKGGNLLGDFQSGTGRTETDG